MAKNTSFKRVWTKTSIKRILKVFSARSDSFLCHASPEFRQIWFDENNCLAIIKQARLFAPDEYEGTTMGDMQCVLFPSLPYDEDKNRKIRIEFLKSEIKRLSK